MKKITLTDKEAAAILSLEKGCDVYSYALAGVLRGIQRRGLPVRDTKAGRKGRGKCLFTICSAMQAPKDGAKQQPYFGAIAEATGLALAHQQLGW